MNKVKINDSHKDIHIYKDNNKNWFTNSQIGFCFFGHLMGFGKPQSLQIPIFDIIFIPYLSSIF